MDSQMKMFDLGPEPAKKVLTLRTYIYFRPDGKCVHVNAGYGFFGQEYEHSDPGWQPGPDWPYEIIDQRQSSES
jgi:hypothetical protein